MLAPGQPFPLLQVHHYVGVQADVTRLVEAEAASSTSCVVNTAACLHHIAAAEVAAPAATTAAAPAGGRSAAVDCRLRAEEAAAARIAAQLESAEALLPHAAPRCAAADSLPSSTLAALTKLQEAFVLVRWEGGGVRAARQSTF